ncbi:hypothetical protein BCR42DRAFT_432806 [Absidia repens]|uniref:Glycerol-3-phosphate dehydrogenase NAD-dependent N-terminal domain-containing protein n=1 Tax=Absidia repens TaxID=90262 RepID=A0A1X2IVN3_9FUNG|nr:hypothetical protein BCR42DRAFT_432806 [Absidia repens]
MFLETVSIIVSGNRGSTVAKLIGTNTQRRGDLFETTVNGEKMTDIINREHENVKYLQGIKLPENIVGVPDVVESCEGASIVCDI